MRRDVRNMTGHWFYDRIYASNSYPYRELRSALAANPPAYEDTNSQLLERINSGGSVTFMQDDDRIRYMAGPYCNIVWIYTGVPDISIHFMFRRNSLLTAAFNRAMRDEKVILKRVMRKYGTYGENRRVKLCARHREEKFQPLGVISILGVVVLGLMGLVAAAGMLLVELVVARAIRRKRADSSYSGFTFCHPDSSMSK